jgi:hypothetical protein
VPTTITCKPFLKIKTTNEFDEVATDRDKTEEYVVEQQNAVHTALASFKVHREQPHCIEEDQCAEGRD